MSDVSGLSHDRPDGYHTLRDVTIILVLAAVLLFPSHFTRDLWNPDEPRYMEVAREMLVLGDYLVPHLNGRIYPDKPPLFFWLTAALYRAGLGFEASRVVSALATMGTLMLIYGFGRKLLPAPGALLAALVTATFALFSAISRIGAIDPLLTFFETVALVAAYHALTGSSPRARLCWLIFYGAAGLAVLTKGPVGLAVPALVVLVYAILERKRIRAGGWMHLGGVALMLVVVGAWLVPACIRGGEEYTRDILFHQSSRYTVKAASHNQGPHYYFMLLPPYLLPWTFFAALALVQGILDWRRKGDRAAGYLSLWLICVFAFFTAVTSKRERYLMPLMPAAGLLCGRYFALALREAMPWPRLHRWLAVVTFVVTALIATGIAAGFFFSPAIVASRFPDDAVLRDRIASLMTAGNLTIVIGASAILLALSIAGLLRGIGKPAILRFAVTVTLIMVTISLFIDLFAFPLADPFKSSREFGRQSLPYLEQAGPSGRFFYQNEFAGVVNLYTGIIGIPLVREVEGLADAMRSGEKVVVIGDEKRLAGAVPSLPGPAWVLVRERVGRRGMALISNYRWDDNARPLEAAAKTEE